MKPTTIAFGCTLLLLMASNGATAGVDVNIYTKPQADPCRDSETCITYCTDDRYVCVTVTHCGPLDFFAEGYPTCIFISVGDKVDIVIRAGDE